MTEGFSAEAGTGSAVRKSDQGHAPILRFPGFAGEWEAAKFDYWFKINAGGDVPNEGTSKKKSAAFPFPIFANSAQNKGLYGFAKSFREEGGCITVSGRGELGIPNARHEPFVPIVRLLVLRPKHPSDVGFFENAIRRTRIFVESTGVPQLTGPQLSSYKIAAPTLPEQKKIAAFFGGVDARLAALAAKQAALGRFKAGLMQKLFSQQLRFTRDDGGDFPDWQEKELRAVSIINPKSPKLPERFRYIDLESVNAGTLGAVSEIDATEAPSRAQRVLQRGDILFQMVRPYQRNNLYFDLDGVYVGSTGYAQIRAKQNRRYLFHVLHTDEFVNRVLERCTGTGYPAINSNDLGKITVPLPHPAEQQKIAATLSAMDAKIQAVADQVAKLQTFKKGLLQQMFV